VVFAEVDAATLCLDPNDIVHRIGPRTKAIVVVHYLGYPADMDPIMAIARRAGLKVIEDVSHAHGGRYHGRQVGSIGDVAATSLMSGKALATGEGGILTTNDRTIYERALAFGHYERYDGTIQSPELRPFAGLPLGGYKYRMHQLSAAVARVQLRHFDERMAEIQHAMNAFWDLLDGTPGLRAHRPPLDSGSTMGGWYAAHGLYHPEELGGLSVTRYAQAVRAEGVPCQPGVNLPLHLHPLFQEVDVYGDGKPTRIAHATRDVREARGSLPVTERAGSLTYSIPWFKHYDLPTIERYAEAFRKPAEHYRDLLPGDPGNPADLGDWHFYTPR
jgi:dTDP-4-amino-4,6-dideoxygalactose transaminase